MSLIVPRKDSIACAAITALQDEKLDLIFRIIGGTKIYSTQ